MGLSLRWFGRRRRSPHPESTSTTPSLVGGWLDCRDLRLLAEIREDSATWNLRSFIEQEVQADVWFGQLDHLCEAEAKARRSRDKRIAGIKQWIELELEADRDFDAFIASIPEAKPEWPRIRAAAAATIILAYCKDRRTRAVSLPPVAEEAMT